MFHTFLFTVTLLSAVVAPRVRAEERLLEDIKIGALFSLSGWAAEGGMAEFGALEIAVQDVNRAGGIGGRKVKLVAEDIRSDLRETATAYKKLATVDKVTAVIGPNWAEFSEIVAPLAHSTKTVTISPSGYKESLFKLRGYFFSLLPPPQAATKSLADYINSQAMGSLTVLLNENAYLLGLMEALLPQLQKGKTKVEVLRFNPGHQDYRSTISKLKQDPPSAVLLLLLLNSDLAPYLRQTRELGFTPHTLISNDLLFDEVITKEPMLAEGAVFFDYIVPGSSTFKQRFRKLAKREPNFGSAKSYDALMLLKRAIETCGDSPSQITTCLYKDNFEGESGTIVFDHLGRLRWNATNTYLLRVEGGKHIPLP